MSELKPVKCRCGSELERRSGVAGSDHVMAWKHPIRSDCPLAVTPILDHEVPTWNLFMSDTPDLIRGAKIGLKMAAKYLDSQIMALPKEHTISYAELSRARTHFSMQAKMPDTDIMKEISRE